MAGYSILLATTLTCQLRTSVLFASCYDDHACYKYRNDSLRGLEGQHSLMNIVLGVTSGQGRGTLIPHHDTGADSQYIQNLC